MDSSSRCATIFLMFELAMSVKADDDAADALPAGAASTSAATIRPFGPDPDPCKAASDTLLFAASLRAYGDATTR